MEYYHSERVIQVYNKGNHTCHLKPKTVENDTFIEENIRKFGANVGPKKIGPIKDDRGDAKNNCMREIWTKTR